ncbi:RAMP superfamily CRISPR-associated protein [Prevotella multiformis]|uniref:CRISPR-associated RAMP protein n=1 Tax=Prevotella multiformis DSM 16608 TaxID=888743 RepID=F0F7Z1_9BACT|nr:RAMP superfamily CRISPR-associated protein [Prevotella multiformis]EGC19834.1 CRISPR-associated RAMP protein [Prevotella multiformis DSM 16608]
MEHTYRYRQLARIILETETPLAIGSGNKDIKTDSVVAKDINELPYIPATTLAGLIRHSLPEELQEYWMGFQKKKDGEGSRIMLSEGKILSADRNPIDGLNLDEDAVTRLCHELPIRQHVRINQQGTAVKNGKFDEEIVPKGVRFCFEIELMAEKDKPGIMDTILSIIQSDGFRIGSGSRSGFGKIEVVGILRRDLDLCVPDELALYLGKSSSLAKAWEGYRPHTPSAAIDPDCILYTLELRPVDFMFFGSGFGDDRSDMTFVREPVVTSWDRGEATVEELERVILIPASSVKGALAHRTAYHYNRLEGVFADKKTAEELEKNTGKENKAVKTLFGSEGDRKGKNKQRGNILFSDVIEKQEASLEKKVLNHVKIDRFTGGAVDGALFSEEVLYASGKTFNLELMLRKTAVDEKDGKIVKAFEAALTDLCKGYLPLGGGVNRGNGTFKGKLNKNGETIYDGYKY